MTLPAGSSSRHGTAIKDVCSVAAYGLLDDVISVHGAFSGRGPMAVDGVRSDTTSKATGSALSDVRSEVTEGLLRGV